MIATVNDVLGTGAVLQGRGLSVLVLIVLIALTECALHGEPASDTLRSEYLRLVMAYTSGDRASALAAASTRKQRQVLAAVQSLHDARRSLGQPGSRAAEGWTPRWVARAALLHIDLASGLTVPLAEWDRDFHLSVTERLLELIEDFDEVREWTHDLSLAVVLRYQQLLKFEDLHRFFDRSLRRYPSSARMFLAAGSAHELASSGRLAAARELGLVDAADHLGSAEKFLTRALELDPGLGDARVRLARVRQLQNRHEEALGLLQSPAPDSDARLLYLSALLRGRSLQRLARVDDALAAFELAATTLPGCQTPGLAVAALLVESGRREESAGRVTDVLAMDGDCQDPWVTYDYAQSPQLSELLERLRKELHP